MSRVGIPVSHEPTDALGPRERRRRAGSTSAIPGTGRRDPTPNLTCEGCGEERGAEKFVRYLKVLENPDVEAPPQYCDGCATYGPPLENPLNELSPRELEGMKILASGGSINSAAKAMKISRTQLRRQLDGRDRSLFRGAYQRILVAQGLDPSSIAKVIAEALGAERPQWNSEMREWDRFPDHSNRLKAAAIAMKALDLNPPNELSRPPEVAHNAVQVNLYTNLGEKETAASRDEYVIEAFATSGDDDG